jgi:hypothetical protein
MMCADGRVPWAGRVPSAEGGVPHADLALARAADVPSAARPRDESCATWIQAPMPTTPASTLARGPKKRRTRS